MSFFRSLFRKSKSNPLEGALRESVEQVIARAYVDPYMGIDLVSGEAITHLGQCGDILQVHVAVS